MAATSRTQHRDGMQLITATAMSRIGIRCFIRESSHDMTCTHVSVKTYPHDFGVVELNEYGFPVTDLKAKARTSVAARVAADAVGDPVALPEANADEKPGTLIHSSKTNTADHRGLDAKVLLATDVYSPPMDIRRSRIENQLGRASLPLLDALSSCAAKHLVASCASSLPSNDEGPSVVYLPWILSDGLDKKPVEVQKLSRKTVHRQVGAAFPLLATLFKNPPDAEADAAEAGQAYHVEKHAQASDADLYLQVTRSRKFDSLIGHLSPDEIESLYDYANKGRDHCDSEKGVIVAQAATTGKRKRIHNTIRANFKWLSASTTNCGTQKKAISISFRNRKHNNKRKRKGGGGSCQNGNGNGKRPKQDLIRCLVRKVYTEHFVALSAMQRELRIGFNDISFCGIKDKNGITYQDVVLRGVTEQSLKRSSLVASFVLDENEGSARSESATLMDTSMFAPLLCKKERGVRIHRESIRPAASFLTIGQHSGNLFRITLRDLQFECACVSNDVGEGGKGGKEIIQAVKHTDVRCYAYFQNAIDSLRQNGFVNYFGTQRFGGHSLREYHLKGNCDSTDKILSCLVGCAMLKGNWKEAVELVLLAPRPGYAVCHLCVSTFGFE